MQLIRSICPLLLLLTIFFASCEKDAESVNFAPKVTTGTAVGISRNDATLSGSIQIPEGTAIKRYGILLSELQGMEEYAEYPVTDNATNFTIQFDALKPGTTYYYCTFATSGINWVKGEIKSFTTIANTSPSLGELVLIEKGTTNCKLSVDMKDDGGTDVALSGFCWIEGEEGEPTIEDKLQSIEMVDSVLVGSIDNLKPNTTYRIRAYATNATGTGYSNTLMVTTDNLPVPVVGEITLIESDVLAVTLSVQVLELYGTELDSIGFCWSTENQQPNIANPSIDLTDQIGEEHFIGTIADLTPSTTYYIRAYATNEAGTGYSQTYVYTTGEIQVPVLSSVQITDSTSRSIDLSAMVEEPGSSEVQKIGYCWSTETETPTTGNFFVDLSEQLGQSEFTVTISDLTPSTTYYIRAYAENKQGIGYSETLTYTTEEDKTIQGTEGSVHLDAAGTLSDYILDYNKYDITKLKISGSINGTDVRLLRDMAGYKGKLVELDLSEAVIVAGGEAYYGNHWTANDELGHYFFYNTRLRQIILPTNIKGIGDYVFGDCASLTDIVIPEGVTSIGGYAFEGCSSLTDITLPVGITSIPSAMFRYCTSLKEINLPNGINSIEGYAFYECSSLTSFKIPEDVTKIEWNTFYGCSSLTSIEIPDGVTSIGEAAFTGCSSLTSINIPEGVTKISNAVFSGCSSLTSIDIPDGITEIELATFSGCSSLTSVDIPDGVTVIGSFVFDGCSSLVKVNLPESVIAIGECLFQNCPSLSDVNLPDGVTEIGSGTFYGCSSLINIDIPDGVTEIGSAAFRGCSSLTSIDIPDGVTEIGEYAFMDCSSLKSLHIPNGVTFIGERTFSGCSGLTTVNIPEDVTEIGDWAFYECSSLTSICIPGKVKSIGLQAFCCCSSLSEVTCKATAPPTLGSEVFASSATDNLLVPTKCVDAYSESDWAQYFSTIKEME